MTTKTCGRSRNGRRSEPGADISTSLSLWSFENSKRRADRYQSSMKGWCTGAVWVKVIHGRSKLDYPPLGALTVLSDLEPISHNASDLHIYALTPSKHSGGGPETASSSRATSNAAFEGRSARVWMVDRKQRMRGTVLRRSERQATAYLAASAGQAYR